MLGTSWREEHLIWDELTISKGHTMNQTFIPLQGVKHVFNVCNSCVGDDPHEIIQCWWSSATAMIQLLSFFKHRQGLMAPRRFSYVTQLEERLLTWGGGDKPLSAQTNAGWGEEEQEERRMSPRHGDQLFCSLQETKENCWIDDDAAWTKCKNK